MKTLPLELEKKGFGYRQLIRRGMAALYEQRWGGLKGRLIAYEVIQIQYHDTYTIGGATIEAGESYPGDSSWGRLGWTFSPPTPEVYQSALDKLSQVEQSQLKSETHDAPVD